MRFLANVLWFLSMLPDYVRFCVALHLPRRAQKWVAQRRKPTTDEDVILLEPTSGSTGGTKWIPYTRQLQREFLRAVNPWIASLYIRHPSLFFATHYWSISPYTAVRCEERDIKDIWDERDGKRRGFAEDRDYLSPLQKTLTRYLFPVPASLAKVQDPHAHATLTLLYLLDAPALGIISIWHPSSLLILLSTATQEAEALVSVLTSGRWPDGSLHRACPERAREVEALLKSKNYSALWPRLRVISCWDSAFATADANRLREIFPNVEVQGKGLIATEGIVTIPWKNRRVAAVTAHTIHLDPYNHETVESNPTRRISVCNAKEGESYSVVLTTGNGFTNYPLGDVVRCVGHIAKTPCLEFQFRNGGVVDLQGEKLHSAHVAEIIERLAAKHGAFQFAMLMPRTDRTGYVFVCSENDSCSEEELETLLCENYHYRHARNLQQLAPVQIRRCHNALSLFCTAKGCSPAAVKIPQLYVPRDPSEWVKFESLYSSSPRAAFSGSRARSSSGRVFINSAASVACGEAGWNFTMSRAHSRARVSSPQNR